MLTQRVPGVRRITQAEALRGLGEDAARFELGMRDLRGRVLRELSFVEAACLVHEREHALALDTGASLRRVLAPVRLRDLETDAFRERARCSRKADALERHQKRKGIAGLL